jgi:hypothetical protein
MFLENISFVLFISLGIFTIIYVILKSLLVFISK